MKRSPASSEEFDIGPVHASEVVDGWMYVVAGPKFCSRTGAENAVFEFACISPEGICRLVAMRVACPEWVGHGRDRRQELLSRMLVSSRTAWSIEDDPSIPLPCATFVRSGLRSGVDLTGGTLLDGDLDIPEMAAFVARARSLPHSPLCIEGMTDSGICVLNDILAFGPHSDLVSATLRRRRWLAPTFVDSLVWKAMCEIVGKTDGRCGPDCDLPDDTVAELLTLWIRRPGWIFHSRMVAFADACVRCGTVPKAAHLLVLDALPRSWVTHDPDELASFERICYGLLAAFKTDLSAIVSALRHCGGRFRRLEDRMIGDIGPDRNLVLALGDIGDMIDAARRDLVCRAEATYPQSSAIVDRGTAARMISPDGGIRRFLQISDRWHDFMRMIHPDAEEASSWPRSAEDFVTSSGCSVVELLDRASLVDEGNGQGHCVGTYGLKCALGGSHVFSIRSSGETLSTFEALFRDDDATLVTIVQHQGPRRRVPCEAAAASLEEWIVAVRTGSLVVVPRVVDHAAMGASARKRPRMTLDQWRPFMAKPWSELDDEEFADAVGELRQHVMRTSGA